MRIWRTAPLAALLVALWLGACGPAAPPPAPPPGDPAAAWKTLGLEGSREDFERALEGLRGVRLDPPPRVGEGYRPTFPPDMPFDPSGWRTGPPPLRVTDPRARKGGTLRLSTSDYPPTLRTEGPNSRLKVALDIQILVYETLLEYDMARGDFVPRLATHWWVSPDGRTLRFRLDERARWSNGSPVTADDVKATLEHLVREDRKDPAVAEQYRGIVEEVRVLDRLTVEVRTREARWQNLVDLGLRTKIYPAAWIRMDGDTYLADWNWKLPPGSGPYVLPPDGVVKGRSITLQRRRDWWSAHDPGLEGMYNFDAIRWEVVRDEELEYQKFLAGEVDAYRVMRAQRWAEEVDREPAVQRGWVQKRKIYTMEPQGYGGYCFNMRIPPFDDRNVREAVAHLFNREKLFEKLFYYEYEYLDSYFPGQVYARPHPQRVRYDPARARRLLAASGWTGRDTAGYLVNARGERFPELTMEYGQAAFQRIHQVLADELWKQAGIKLTLQQVDWASLLKKTWEYRFTLTYFNWTATLFPDPEFNFHSRYASEPQSNNLNGLRNPTADALMDAYGREPDQRKRVLLLQRLDAVLFAEHPYALAWYAPYFRVVYWDRFGHPPEYTDRFTGDMNALIRFWWFDPERARRTESNRSLDRPNHPDRPGNQEDSVEHRYWLDHEDPMPDREAGGEEEAVH